MLKLMRWSAPLSLFRAGGGCHARGVACIYTVDVAKRLKTYRLDPGECADFAWAVSETGESETEVLRRAILAYIQAVKAGDVTFAAPVNEPPVYTDVESLPSYDEPPAEKPCRHPVDAVDPDTSICRECGADVW